MRLGLVGIGDAGGHHARALSVLHQGGVLQWSALVSRRPAALSLLGIQPPPELQILQSLEALIANDRCDAVIIATPDSVHATQVETAIRAGLAVLVEKPFTSTGVEAKHVWTAARSCNRLVMVGHHLRHHSSHKLMLELLPARVGRIRHIDVRWAWPDPAVDGWRARGAQARFWSLAALGTHAIDLIFMLSGTTDVTDVLAMQQPSLGQDHACELVLQLRGDDDQLTMAHVSVAVTHRAASIVRVTGDDGELVASATMGARGIGELHSRSGRSEATVVPFVVQNPYEAQMRAFVGRVPGGFDDDESVLANVAVVDRVASLLSR
jgi:predicted dehydrogenase